VRVIGDDVEEALDDLLQNQGGFDVVVSAPFARLPYNPWRRRRQALGARAVPRGLRASSSTTSSRTTSAWRAGGPGAELPDRAADAGHLLRVVAGGVRPGAVRQELAARLHGHPWRGDERLPTYPAVNQVQLTRRARTEEPANERSSRRKWSAWCTRCCSAPCRHRARREPLPGADLPRQRGHGVGRP
jgi:malonyl-CoA reductase/3-hydroxypropionate dehydrogenase (NADP+)